MNERIFTFLVLCVPFTSSEKTERYIARLSRCGLLSSHQFPQIHTGGSGPDDGELKAVDWPTTESFSKIGTQLK